MAGSGEAAPVRGWRALPPPLVLAMCMAVIASIADAIDRASALPTVYMPTSPATHFGLYIATRGLELYGVVLLLRRHHGTPWTGLRLVVASTALALVTQLVSQVLYASDVQRWLPILRVVWFVIPLLFAIGIGTALWRAGRGRAIAALGIALVLYVLPMVLPAMLPLDAVRAYFLASSITWILQTALLAWVVAQLAGDAPPPAPARIARGLRHARHALQLLAVAMMGTLLLAIAPAGARGAVELLGYIYAMDLLLGAFALGWLGISLARAAAVPGGEPGAYLLGIAGALLLVCGGGMAYAAQVEVASWLRDRHWNAAAVLGVGPVLVVAAIGGTVLAATIARFAGRTGFESLRRGATAVAVGCGGLGVAALLASDHVIGVEPRTALFAAAFVLAACQLLAYLCKRAAGALEHTSHAVPVARVVAD